MMAGLGSAIFVILAVACESSKTTPGLVAKKVQEAPLVDAGDQQLSLRGRALATCANRVGVTCMCQNPSFPCYAPYGTGCACYSYMTNATCVAAKGVFCVRPAKCVANCSLCQDTKTCYSCASGYMLLRGQCMIKPATVADTWLKIHNVLRCIHGSSYVRWNNFSTASALAYVNTLRSMVHSNSYYEPPPAGPAGENLAMGFGNLVDAAVAWYNEVVCCGPFPGCATNHTCEIGHFTAMIWSGVSEIGCAINTTTKIYICRYRSGNTLSSKTANMAGAYTQNVFAPQKTLAQCIGEADGTIPTTVTSTSTVTQSSTTTRTVTVTTRTTTRSSTTVSTRTTATTSTASSTTETTETSTSTTLPFQIVDGADRACRGDNSTDKVPSYYVLYNPLSPLSACQALCLNNTMCVGIQYSIWSRCEVWIRPQGIGTTASVTGYTCMRLVVSTSTSTGTETSAAATATATVTATATRTLTATVTSTVAATTVTGTVTAVATTTVTRTSTATTTVTRTLTATSTVTVTTATTTVTRTSTATSTGTRTVTSTATTTATTATRTTSTVSRTSSTTLPFQMVDGGTDRACRGDNSTDKVPSYYLLYDPLSPLSACQALCLSNTKCVGVQYSIWSRCEVWIRPGGINSSAAVTGYTCMRLVSSS